MTTIINSDTIWSGDVILTDNVQIAPGATLTIAEGTSLNGAGYKIEVGGHLQSAGTASRSVDFTNVNLNYLANTPSSPAQIDIDFTDWNGGSFLAPTGNAVYGSFTLEDSAFTGVNAGWSFVYVWYPTSEVTVARNVFNGSAYFSVGTSSVDVNFENNVFVNQPGIEVWAAYGTADVSVVGNSFLNISSFALEVPSGYSNASFGTVDNNYFGDLSQEQIEALILDRNDDLNRASYIDPGTIATAPDVNTPNLAPAIISAITDQSAQEDQAFNFQFADDAFVDIDTGDALTYSATLANGDALPSWLHFDASTRSFAGTPENGGVGTISVKVTATDGSNASVSDTFDITVGNTNDTPTLAHALADRSATQDGAFNFQFAGDAFADVDAGDTLTYSATLANGDPLPSWLQFDASTRTFSGTPGNGDVGTISVKVTATDGSNASVSDTFDVTVGNVNDAPTLAHVLADQSATQDQVFNFQFAGDAFADIDAGDTLAYSATLANGDPLPSWLSFDAVTRTFSGTPGNGDVGVISIKMTATDVSDASVSDTFDISVGNVNDAPALAHALGDQSSTQDQVFNFQFADNTFADVDAGDTLTYSATLASGDALPSWLQFDASTRTFSGTPGNSDVGAISVKVTAIDGSKASVSDTFDISVADVNDAPTIAHAVADQSAAEGTEWTFAVPDNAFSDVDGNALAYTATLASGDPLPSWLSFNAATRTFTGTPPSDSDHVVSLKVTASDGELSASDTFDLTINHAPTNVNLSGDTVQENVRAGTVIGTLSGSDSDDGDHLAFTLVDNPGHIFVIKNGKLVVAAGADIDFETHHSYAISVRATDGGGLHHDETFAITVTDVVDQVNGTKAADTLKGASAADIIKGLGGNDALYGNAGNDMLEGGKGVDKLYGGTDADTFVFVTGDSGKTHAKADTIFDFTKADSIDLTGWDANAKVKGVQDFDFIGKHAFTGHAGELHFVREKSDTWIEGDTNGDKSADFVIHLDDAATIKAAHFDL